MLVEYCVLSVGYDMVVCSRCLSVMVAVTSDDMVVWRCASMALGAPSVMTSGTTEMPVWCADNWDTPHMVGLEEYMIYKSLDQILFSFVMM